MGKTWTNTESAGGKYTVALSAEIRAAIDSLWMRRGTSTLAGSTGQTITLSPVEATVNYDIIITFNADPGPDVGHIWVPTADKAVGSFKVYNQGASGGGFTWTLVRQLT